MNDRVACSFLPRFFTTGMQRDAGCQRNALSHRHHLGVHPLVCSLSAQLPPLGGNDYQERGVFDDHFAIKRWAIRVFLA